MIHILKFSQLATDVSTASAAIHELRNSLVPINRLSLDVLLLIPTYLVSMNDRLRATFVCRRWRKAFVQYPPLWSKLYLAGRTDRSLFTTLLQRVRGTPLDVTIDNSVSPVHDVAIFSPFAPQIRSLNVKGTLLGVHQLSMAISVPLLLLQTLAIEVRGFMDFRETPATIFPLFTNAVNVNKFSLFMNESPSLSKFTFPNLTTFNFSTSPKKFAVSQLLDFLEASPALRHVDITVTPSSFNEDVPPKRVVVLPHIESFLFCVTHRHPGCEISTHISCPSAKRTVFHHLPQFTSHGTPKNIYPPSLPLTTIVRQYTNRTIDQAILDLETPDGHLSCSLTFRSSNGATLELRYTHHTAEDSGDMDRILSEILPPIFSQACRTIRDHPLFVDVRHLSINGGGLITGNLGLATNDIGRLLGCMGSLERLTLHDCDLRPFLDAFLETPQFPEAFPHIKKLAVV